MARRSLFEDALLTSALALDIEMSKWGVADLVERAAQLTGEEIPSHVVTRAMRKFRQVEWLEAEPDPDSSLGPRFLYHFTDKGLVEARRAAGREVALGRDYALVPLRLIPLPQSR